MTRWLVVRGVVVGTAASTAIVLDVDNGMEFDTMSINEQNYE